MRSRTSRQRRGIPRSRRRRGRSRSRRSKRSSRIKSKWRKRAGGAVNRRLGGTGGVGDKGGAGREG